MYSMYLCIVTHDSSALDKSPSIAVRTHCNLPEAPHSRKNLFGLRFQDTSPSLRGRIAGTAETSPLLHPAGRKETPPEMCAPLNSHPPSSDRLHPTEPKLLIFPATENQVFKSDNYGDISLDPPHIHTIAA